MRDKRISAYEKDGLVERSIYSQPGDREGDQTVFRLTAAGLDLCRHELCMTHPYSAQNPAHDLAISDRYFSLTPEEREREMKKAQAHGISIVLGTIGEEGSWVLYRDNFYYTLAVRAEDVIDTMGAGDSYFAAFLCSLLSDSASGALIEEDEEEMAARLKRAMNKGAVFAAKVCAMEGAFGYGVPITGRTQL